MARRLRTLRYREQRPAGYAGVLAQPVERARQRPRRVRWLSVRYLQSHLLPRRARPDLASAAKPWPGAIAAATWLRTHTIIIRAIADMPFIAAMRRESRIIRLTRFVAIRCSMVALTVATMIATTTIAVITTTG